MAKLFPGRTKARTTIRAVIAPNSWSSCGRRKRCRAVDRANSGRTNFEHSTSNFQLRIFGGGALREILRGDSFGLCGDWRFELPAGLRTRRQFQRAISFRFRESDIRRWKFDVECSK